MSDTDVKLRRYYLFSFNLATVNDCGPELGSNCTGRAAESLDLLDDLVGISISNFTENDVVAVKP